MKWPETSGGDGNLERGNATAFASETPKRSWERDRWGNLAEQFLDKRTGGVMVTNHRIVKAGETLKREKPRRGTTGYGR